MSPPRGRAQGSGLISSLFVEALQEYSPERKVSFGGPSPEPAIEDGGKEFEFKILTQIPQDE